MRYVSVFIAVLVAALGVAGVVHGEADDSPGLQLIGVALVVAAVAVGVRFLRSGARRRDGAGD
jgi:hypothetical protein